MSYRSLLKTVSASVLLSLAAGLPAQAVIFHSGSGSIDGSLCVGNDCVSSESFGFDTIRLKENNLRLDFQDTSVAAAFSPNDWRIIVNDSANGGDSHFSVEDRTAGRQVFRIFAGARSNALVVDSQGDVGIGLSAPLLDLHIKTGDTPGIRLEQDGTSGFSPQTWDVAGNEAGFFIRDATSGSTLPFRIMQGGAPSQSLVVDDNGNIGIGAGTSPDEALHVRRTGTDQTARILVESSTGDAILDLEANDPGQASRINFVSDGSVGDPTLSMVRINTFFRMNFAAGANEFQLDDGGNLTITGNLVTGGGGICDPGPCDAVFDPAVYTVPSIEEHAALMWENQYLPAVGPTRPGEPVNVTLKLTRMLNELEHAHIYIEQLHERMAAQESRIEELTRRIPGQ